MNYAILYKFFFVFVIVALFFAENIWASSAPATQPSKKGKGQYPKVSCNEWDKEQGREGKCIVETETTSWEQYYYREGKERLTWKGKIKNLTVFFPGDGYDHKIHNWWGFVVGKGKAIDPDKFVILGLSRIGTGTPAMGSSILLTTEEMATTQMAVIDYLYPNRKKFVVGGPSRGADNALLINMLYPKDVSRLIIVQSHLASGWSEGKGEKYMDQFDKWELQHGPYTYWPLDLKKKWWGGFNRIEIESMYTDRYFSHPEFLSEHEKSPKDYQSPDNFKDTVVNNWTNWSVEYADPKWDVAARKAWKTTDFGKDQLKNLSKRILMIANQSDQAILFDEVKRFKSTLEGVGKNVMLVSFEDIHGHMSCCTPSHYVAPISEAIKNFLK